MATLYNYTLTHLLWPSFCGVPKFPPKKRLKTKKGKRAFTTLQRNYVEAANTRKKRDREKANPQLTGFLGKQFSVLSIVLNKITSIVDKYIPISIFQYSKQVCF